MITPDPKQVRKQALHVLTEMLDAYGSRHGHYEHSTEVFCNYVIVNSDEPHVLQMWQKFYETWDLGSSQHA